MLEWSQLGHNQLPLSAPASLLQKNWDIPVVEAVADNLLTNAPHERARARLLASAIKESGAWLNAIPLSSCGLCMDNETIRVAIGLRLGAPLCHPHQCQHCGSEVGTEFDELATHGLSCRSSEGHIPQHTAINDIIC